MAESKSTPHAPTIGAAVVNSLPPELFKFLIANSINPDAYKQQVAIAAEGTMPRFIRSLAPL